MSDDFQKDVESNLDELKGMSFVVSFALIGFLAIFGASIIMLTIYLVRS